MRIEILKPTGYCAGVSKAIQVAFKAKEATKNGETYVLGMLVHNDVVNNMIKKKSIKIISSDDLMNGTIHLTENDSIVFPAHGITKEVVNYIKSTKTRVYDAVCPKVKQNIETILKANENRLEVIYIGVKGHPESLSALSYGDNINFYDINSDFDYKKIKSNNPIAINQTTLNFKEIQRIHNEIINQLPDSKILNEVCNTTRLRQESLLNLEDDVDLIIIAGDKKSSNGNRLLEIAKTSHPNVTSIMVTNADEIDEIVYINKKHVVISSSASTPLDTINAIFNKINRC